MVYLELEKQHDENGRKHLRYYMEKTGAWKEKKEKEAEANVAAESVCRGRGKRY